ncbi:MAG: class A beta-lactamase [Caulobacteraceae bacterium]|nr:class A beta-lactamase [Caulobacteraceae bacterium]
MPHLLILLAIAILGGCEVRAGHGAEAPPPPPPSPTRPAHPLAARIQALGAGFDGDVGIAVLDLQTGWTTSWPGAKAMPQQSVAKLWAALALLDAADRGGVRLNEPVVVTRDDLSIFHQPIRPEVMKPGGLHTTLDQLLRGALTQSDNAANQFIVGRVGGPQAVQAVLDAKGLKGIRFGPGERVLQPAIAGLTWRREYSYGKWFWRARAFVPKAERQAALDRYLKDPMDGATPLSIVRALARLQKGELLSPGSTRLMLAVMAMSETGPNRLRAGLEPGWSMAHKTGTGQVLDAVSTGYNDVALITAPNGRVYAVAVMIASTERSIPERQALMAAVSRAVVDWHDGRDPNVLQDPSLPSPSGPVLPPAS